MKKISPEALLQTPDEMLLETFPKPAYGLTRRELRAMKKEVGKKTKATLNTLESVRESHRAKTDTNQGKRLLKEALQRIEELEKLNSTLVQISETPQSVKIQPRLPSGHSESVAVMVASDWHWEEKVLPIQVNGLNEFSPKIADVRATNFFRGGQRLWDIMRKDTQIKTIVLALLGDFITNTIHEDAAESNYLDTVSAIIEVQEKLVSGINFLLDQTDCDIRVFCHSGNHGRMTKKQHIATESGNSLERYLYYNVMKQFAGNNRVQFVIGEGYHTYLELWDKYTIRFHHGHAMRYGGGVGGVYIPVNKSIAQWNKGRKVDLDVFGHFHQFIDAGNFVCNGSLIGYNAYALSIKADYEKPQQAFFLVNRKWNAKSMVTPIFV